MVGSSTTNQASNQMTRMGMIAWKLGRKSASCHGILYTVRYSASDIYI